MISAAAVSAENTTPFSHARLGMLLFLASEAMFFTGLLGAVLILRRTSPDWAGSGILLSQPFVIGSCALLIISCFCAGMAVLGAKAQALSKIRTGLLSFLVLGIFFLGMQFAEYHQWFQIKKILPGSSMFAACFYILTGIHSLHAAAGIFAAAALLRGRPSASGLELFSWYWSFVTVIWIFLIAFLSFA